MMRLQDKVVLVTGGNSGIGLEAAKMLGAAGADVVIACRNPDKARKALEEIAAVSKGKAETVQLDLSDMSSIREAAAASLVIGLAIWRASITATMTESTSRPRPAIMARLRRSSSELTSAVRKYVPICQVFSPKPSTSR